MAPWFLLWAAVAAEPPGPVSPALWVEFPAISGKLPLPALVLASDQIGVEPARPSATPRPPYQPSLISFNGPDVPSLLRHIATLEERIAELEEELVRCQMRGVMPTAQAPARLPEPSAVTLTPIPEPEDAAVDALNPANTAPPARLVELPGETKVQ